MRLLPDWPLVLRRAWSVRLIALSALCDVAGVALAVSGTFAHQRGPALWLQVAGALLGIAGFVARLVYQQNLPQR